MHEQEMQSNPVNHRSADELEAESVKYNIARVVRLTSGAFALFTHHREGAIDLIKVGTIEEIAPHIPTAEQCSAPRSSNQARKQSSVSNLLADIGL